MRYHGVHARLWRFGTTARYWVLGVAVLCSPVPFMPSLVLRSFSSFLSLLSFSSHPLYLSLVLLRFLTLLLCSSLYLVPLSPHLFSFPSFLPLSSLLSTLFSLSCLLCLFLLYCNLLFPLYPRYIEFSDRYQLTAIEAKIKYHLVEKQLLAQGG